MHQYVPQQPSLASLRPWGFRRQVGSCWWGVGHPSRVNDGEPTRGS